MPVKSRTPEVVNAVRVPTEVIAVCAACVTVKAVPEALPVTLPVNGPTNPVAVTVLLNVAAPAALPSIVKKVVSAPPSVPFRIISESFAAASIVMLPEEVVIRTAASPIA